MKLHLYTKQGDIGLKGKIAPEKPSEIGFGCGQAVPSTCAMTICECRREHRVWEEKFSSATEYQISNPEYVTKDADSNFENWAPGELHVWEGEYTIDHVRGCGYIDEPCTTCHTIRLKPINSSQGFTEGSEPYILSGQSNDIGIDEIFKDIIPMKVDVLKEESETRKMIDDIVNESVATVDSFVNEYMDSISVQKLEAIKDLKEEMLKKYRNFSRK